MEKNMATNVNPDIHMVRHALATVVYRGAKTFRDAPAGFDLFRVNETSRAPVEIVAHMGDLFDWALSIAKGTEVWHSSPSQAWKEEITRFYASIKEFDAFLADSPLIACPLERLFQGPIADAMTHVGQLAMLRHLFGSPIRGENYFRADIKAGQIGPEQTSPKREFD
jgi:hypothetical protein